MSDESSKLNKVLRIWAVTDKKPGHQNQTQGLIEALSQYRQVDVTWKSPVPLFKNLQMIFNNKLNNSGEDSHNQLPDLLIGTGHQTHVTLLAMKLSFGGQVVIMMSPSLPVGLFDLCFIPRHDKPNKRSNVVETLGPINRVTPSLASDINSGLILVGGPSRHFSWDSASVAKKIGTLLAQDTETQWVIAGSRRTPDDLYTELKISYSDAKVILPDVVSSDWLPGKVRQSGKIWVTEDSISMVYESLTSGAETGVIRLANNKVTRVSEEIDRLISEGRLLMNLENDNIKSVTNSINKAQSMPEKILPAIYEADRCAKVLLQNFNL